MDLLYPIPSVVVLSSLLSMCLVVKLHLEQQKFFENNLSGWFHAVWIPQDGRLSLLLDPKGFYFILFLALLLPHSPEALREMTSHRIPPLAGAASASHDRLRKQSVCVNVWFEAASAPAFPLGVRSALKYTLTEESRCLCGARSSKPSHSYNVTHNNTVWACVPPPSILRPAKRWVCKPLSCTSGCSQAFINWTDWLFVTSRLEVDTGGFCARSSAGGERKEGGFTAKIRPYKSLD